MIRTRNGVALLEVLAALAILGTAAIALISVTHASLVAVARAESSDRESREARALMEAASLWSADDLDRHLGRRPQGRWTMRVDRPRESVYGITLLDSLDHAVVATFVYRPRPIEVRDAR